MAAADAHLFVNSALAYRKPSLSFTQDTFVAKCEECMNVTALVATPEITDPALETPAHKDRENYPFSSRVSAGSQARHARDVGAHQPRVSTLGVFFYFFLIERIKICIYFA